MKSPAYLDRTLLALAAAPLMVAGTAQAQSPMSASAPPPKPMMSATPAPKPAADMQAVLSAQQALGAKPIETLTPAVARRQPSPSDGVMAVMRKQGMPTAPDPAVTTRDLAYGSDAKQMARVYMPAGPAPARMMRPMIVYYHGGGFVIADLETYDATPRFLAKQLDAIVVSVEYRHAPEAKFPAQHEDAVAAYRWALANAARLGADPRKIALAGESAGGNLAVATAIYARDHKLAAPVGILAVYPIANSDKTLPSKMENANAKPLNTAMLGWFSYYDTTSSADVQDPRLNLVAADLHGLPPTTIVNAQIDPLRSDGETLAQAMRGAGDQVEQRTFPGVTHEFFGMGKVVRGAYDAETYAVGRMKTAFAM